MGFKRPRESKNAGSQWSKRKKTGASKKVIENPEVEDVNVAIDDLNWKEVTLPDKLDDFTGFFGLEEIEGVDVVRPEGKGDLRFKVWISTCSKQPSTNRY
jgi:ATP-dependent RNA helicase DDX24/MAK5